MSDTSSPTTSPPARARMTTKEWLGYVNRPIVDKQEAMSAYGGYQEMRAWLAKSVAPTSTAFNIGQISTLGPRSAGRKRACLDHDAGIPVPPEPDWSK